GFRRHPGLWRVVVIRNARLEKRRSQSPEKQPPKQLNLPRTLSQFMPPSYNQSVCCGDNLAHLAVLACSNSSRCRLHPNLMRPDKAHLETTLGSSSSKTTIWLCVCGAWAREQEAVYAYAGACMK